MTYPQPHENVQAIDRQPFLSLEKGNLPVRDLLRGLARHLNTTTLVGDAAPVVQRMRDRITNPIPGDLVVETSSIYFRGDDDRALKGFGILLLERKEWWTTNEQWEKDLADGHWDERDKRPVDRAWYVQYGPELVDICRWTNCTFTTLPWPDEQFSVSAGTREGNATVFTRDSLMTSLADSGINLKQPEKDWS